MIIIGMANCYNKILYQMAITNLSITVIPTTKTGLYKLQIVIIHEPLDKRRFVMFSCEQ